MVASAAGCSIPARVTFYARHLLKSVYKEKSTTSNEVVLFGDPPVHLPRPKNSPRGCFCPAGRGRGVATCGYRIRLRPLGGACLLRPLRLLRLPVSAAGGGRLRSRLFDSRTPLLLTMYNKKKKAQPLAKLSFLVTRTGIELLGFLVNTIIFSIIVDFLLR